MKKTLCILALFAGASQALEKPRLKYVDPEAPCRRMKLLMKLAHFTEPEVMIMVQNVHQLLFAETVIQMIHASFQILITFTTLILLEHSKEKMLWSKKSIKMDLLPAVLLFQKIL